MNNVTHGPPFVFAYVDENLVVSSTPDDCAVLIHLLFQCLATSSSVINVAKVELGVYFVLCHHLDPNGIRPLANKVELIRDFLRALKKFGQFLVLVNFYHQLVPNPFELIQSLGEPLLP